MGDATTLTMRYFKRQHACAVCGSFVIADLRTEKIDCACGEISIPRYVTISPYNLKRWKTLFSAISEEEYAELTKILLNRRLKTCCPAFSKEPPT